MKTVQVNLTQKECLKLTRESKVYGLAKSTLLKAKFLSDIDMHDIDVDFPSRSSNRNYSYALSVSDQFKTFLRLVAFNKNTSMANILRGLINSKPLI
jgi:hypothetical protein